MLKSSREGRQASRSGRKNCRARTPREYSAAPLTLKNMPWRPVPSPVALMATAAGSVSLLVTSANTRNPSRRAVVLTCARPRPAAEAGPSAEAAGVQVAVTV